MSNAFRPVTRLRSVGLAMPNYEEALEFYTSLWGLELVAEDGNIAFLGTPADPEHYVIRLRKDADKRLDVVAFGADDAATVDAAAAHLIAQGVQIDREPGALDTPGGGYGLRFFDIDGRLIEISADVEGRPYRELEERESIPQCLSHVVFNTQDIHKTKAFYEDVLGFKLSDWNANFMCFLRCNSKHHSLALAQGPHTALNHVSFEMRGIDEFMRASGRVMRSGRQQLWGPGRHGAGDNTFTYFLDETGNVVEYTTELELVEDEDAWVVRTFEATDEAADQWGTGGRVTERMIPTMFNEPDRGLWTSSPV